MFVLCRTVGALSELSDCRTVGLSDLCRTSVGRLSGPCRTVVLPPVGPLPSLSHYSFFFMASPTILLSFLLRL